MRKGGSGSGETLLIILAASMSLLDDFMNAPSWGTQDDQQVKGRREPDVDGLIFMQEISATLEHSKRNPTEGWGLTGHMCGIKCGKAASKRNQGVDRCGHPYSFCMV